MTTKKAITRKRGDTVEIIVTVLSNKKPVDISGWTAIKLTVDPSQDPVNADNNFEVLNVTLVAGGTT